MRRKSSLMTAPIQGAIASKIWQLTTSAVQEFTRPDKDKLSDFIDMLDRDPVSKACTELKALRATIAIGNYENETKDHQKWVRDNFDEMEDTIANLVGELCSSMPLGFAVAEIVFDNEVPGYRDEWRLRSLNVLDPQRVSFAGSNGRIEWVVYRDGQGSKKYIPYGKCIHVKAGFITNFSRPYGSAECKRAYPYFKAKQIILSEMTIAAKNNATGILVGKAESNDSVVLLDPNGKPIMDYTGKPVVVPSPQSLMYQLQNLENSSVIVTDKKNEISALQMNAGEAFWNMALTFLNNQIMLAFGVPTLIFNEGSGGLGNAGLSQQHRTILDSQIESITLQIRDQIVEKIVKPLLVFNFGESTSFGSFGSTPTTDPTLIASRMNTIMTGLQTSIFTTSDIDVMNALRDSLDLPRVDPAKQQELALQNAQQQALVQQIQMQAQQPADDPNQQQAPGGNYP